MHSFLTDQKQYSLLLSALSKDMFRYSNVDWFNNSNHCNYYYFDDDVCARRMLILLCVRACFVCLCESMLLLLGRTTLLCTLII